MQNSVEISAVQTKAECALIMLTRTPLAGYTKTRMMPQLSPDECAQLHKSILSDLSKTCEKLKNTCDVIVAYDSPHLPTKEALSLIRSTFTAPAIFIEQQGETLGNRLSNAAKYAFENSYKSCILIGSDSPEISVAQIQAATTLLKRNPEAVVLGPAYDGGYYLIGMNSLHEEAFSLTHYGHNNVLEETLQKLEETHVNVELLETLEDLDTWDDAKSFVEKSYQNNEISTLESANYLRQVLSQKKEFQIEKHSTNKHAKSSVVAEKPSLSIVIPVLNEEENLPKLLEQLLGLHSAGEFEIIFVDGGSRDESVRLIEQAVARNKHARFVGKDANVNANANTNTGTYTNACEDSSQITRDSTCSSTHSSTNESADSNSNTNIRLVQSKKGRGVQLNAGARQAQANTLLFLHADSIVPQNLVDEVESVCKTSNYGCFGITFDDSSLLMKMCSHLSNFRAFTRGLPFGDQGVFLSKELFWSLGGFPEIALMEDYELALQLKKKGYKPTATHSRIKTSARRYGSTTKSRLYTMYKMLVLRRMYRKGVPVDEIAKSYRNG